MAHRHRDFGVDPGGLAAIQPVFSLGQQKQKQ
jgi:hypothetical protein